MHFFLVALLLFFLPACSSADNQSYAVTGWHSQLCTIDAAIDKLTNLRDLELAKASRAQDQGDRLQFRNNELMDARRYWQQAENSKEIAARYQEEIDKLEVQRAELLREHGITDPNYGRNNPNCKASRLKNDPALQSNN